MLCGREILGTSSGKKVFLHEKHVTWKPFLFVISDYDVSRCYYYVSSRLTVSLVQFFFFFFRLFKSTSTSNWWEWLVDESTIVRSLVDNRLVSWGMIVSWSLSLSLHWLAINKVLDRKLTSDWLLFDRKLISDYLLTINVDRRLIIVRSLIDQWVILKMNCTDCN